MKQQDQKLYWILAFLSLAGYAWLGYNLYDADHAAPSVCIFKGATGIPCPSCGITRSVIFLLQGDVSHALWTNPLGVLAFLMLLAVPGWILFDLATGRKTLLEAFRRTEAKIKTNKMLYVPLIVLIVSNWGWNIWKDL